MEESILNILPRTVRIHFYVLSIRFRSLCNFETDKTWSHFGNILDFYILNSKETFYSYGILWITHHITVNASFENYFYILWGIRFVRIHLWHNLELCMFLVYNISLKLLHDLLNLFIFINFPSFDLSGATPDERAIFYRSRDASFERWDFTLCAPPEKLWRICVIPLNASNYITI